MDYSESLISHFVKEWKSQGYTDIIIIDHGLLYALYAGKYFAVHMMKEDNRINIYDDSLPGSVWNIHAITLGNS